MINTYKIIANNYISILSKNVNNPFYKITIEVLKEFIKYLNGGKNPVPSKENLKITVDVIKELIQQYAQSYIEYSDIEKQAEFLKNLIEWCYPNKKSI